MKTNQTLPIQVIFQPLEKFIIAALIKLKNALSGENTLTGIQFYGDIDD